MRQANGMFRYNCTIIDLYEWKDFIIHLKIVFIIGLHLIALKC